MKKTRRWLWLLLPAGLLVVLVIAAVLWATLVPSPMPEALAALQPGPGIAVETEPWIVFEPTDRVPKTGLIFYPGGRVDPRSYAPAARAIAEEGFLVVIPPMPLNLAVLDPDRAAEVQSAFSEIERWTIGGHSLGGAMAAQFTADSPGQVDGLVLWAGYPPDSTDLSGTSLSVASIYGSLDGVAPPSQILESRGRLPTTTAWIEITGGNHAQFGWYGPQSGDNPATITREDQQQQAIAATLRLLRFVEGE